MCEALKELIRPEIEAEVKNAAKEAREERDAELINKWRAQGKSEEEIKALLR